VAAPAFFTVAGDNKQRVVDANGETNHRDHVDDIEREVGEAAHNGGQTERDDDRRDCQDEWHADGDQRAEDDDQDQNRQRHGKRLGLVQVLGRDIVERLVRLLLRSPTVRTRVPFPPSLAMVATYASTYLLALSLSPMNVTGMIVVW